MTAYAQTGGSHMRRVSKGRLIITQPMGLASYGSKLQQLADQHLQEMISTDELLRYHTLAPTHLSFRRPDDRPGTCEPTENWLLTDWTFVHSKAARLCPVCVEEDIAQYGCGHWRREHQLRHVCICTRHGQALHEKCTEPGCDATLGTLSKRLPSQPCPTCKSAYSVPLEHPSISHGYASFCKLFTDAVEMYIPEVAPSNRHELQSFSYDVCGGRLDVFEQMLKHWLGPQACHAGDAAEIAIEWLRAPIETQCFRLVEPSWVLLAAFKRDITGSPAGQPEYYW
ncbi:MAG: TniQ family protein [Gammaproteobacteria bacterium]|nr:TniQ family protein [Gammaproteobacteria bacterium]